MMRPCSPAVPFLWGPVLWGLIFWGCLLGVPSAAPPAATGSFDGNDAAITTVLDAGVGGSADGHGRLTVTANGQRLACITAGDDSADGAGNHGGGIVACDPTTGAGRRMLVAAPAADQPVPLALGFIDMTVLAAVCRSGDEWSLRTWRLRPDAPADPSEPLQTVPLGRATGSAAGVGLAVSHSREWLVVTGLPTPLPAVLRAAIAGVRVGPPSARHCPRLAPGVRPVAVTVGPRDELVLIERQSNAPPASDAVTPQASDAVTPPAGDAVSFFDATGLCLLRLDTGLTAIRDVAFAPEARVLWVVADDTAPRQPRGGLWRLDATLRGGHQAVAAVPVADLPAPLAVACPTKKSVLVTHPRAEGLRVVCIPVPPPGATP